MLFLENSGEQVPKKVHCLIKRGSDRLDRILDGSHRTLRKDSSREEDGDAKRRKNSMEYKPEQSRLDTIPSPNLIEAEQEPVNESLLISPVEYFGINSYGALPLIPTISNQSLSNLPLPANFHKSSMDSLHPQDTISLSSCTGNITCFQLPERLIEAIALNYRKSNYTIRFSQLYT